MNTKILEEIGLTFGEIKTYIALLRIGSSSTGPLAKESGVSRSKLYSILDKLEKKGLASHIEKRGVVYFQAVEPSKIKDYLKEKEDNLKSLEKDFENFLPQLESMKKGDERVQNVTVYQGLKGLITAHEHTYLSLKKGEEYVYLGIPKEHPTTQHLYWERDHIRRVKEGIKCRLLFNKDTPKELLDHRNRLKFSEARYMPIDLKTPSYFLIYKNTVMIAIPSENPLVIEIVSKEIAESFMAYFEDFWKRSKSIK